VSKRLIHRAWVLLSENKTVSKARFLAFYQMNSPKTMWRIAKSCGLVYARQVLRRSILLPFTGFLNMKPYPGDEDYVLNASDMEEEMSPEDAIAMVAMSQQQHIRGLMTELVDRGLTGDVIMVAMRLGLVASLDTVDLRNTPTLTAMEIVRDNAIAKKLDNQGYFDILIEEAVLGLGQARSVEDLEHGIDGSCENEYDTIVLDPQPKTFWGRVFKRIRKIAFKFSGSNWFDAAVLLTILVSSVMLCLETPVQGIREPKVHKLVSPAHLWLVDIICNAIFCFEALSKIFAFGFWEPLSVDHVPYFRSNANRLDLFVLLMALAEMTGIGAYIGTGTTKILRLMKVMRPLRLMSRSEGLKKIIIALVASVKPMVFAVIFLTIIIVIFSVMAMAFFKDKFSYCTDMQLDGSKNEGELECLGQYLRAVPGVSLEEGGLYMPRAWTQPAMGQNFDTFGSSMLVLFRCLTLKWVQYYASAQDAPFQAGIQPIPGNQMILSSIFFHIFILFGSLFSMNLLASFMCDAFYSIQGDDQLEEIQWISVQKMVKENWPRKPHPPPKNRISALVRKLLASTRYKAFSVLCLMVNVVFMSTAHAGQAGSYAQILDIQNTIFFGQMCSEAFFYLLSVGPALYVKDRGNQFDMLLILATSITMLFQEEMRTMSQGVRILRLFKFGRALSQDRTISNVFETVIVSIGQVANIFVVLVVLIMMFSVLSVQLFGSVKFGVRHGSQVKFSTFQDALRSIFQIMFGDEWHLIQDDCMIQEPACTPNIYDPDDPNVLLYSSDCGGMISAGIFFPALLILGNYVILNLFVGMIMNNFAYINCKDSNGVLEPEDFVNLSNVWVSKFDNSAIATIKLEEVYSLMHEIRSPLGFYGTEENIGRYLCVREELRQKLKYLEEHPEKKGGRIYNWVRDRHEGIHATAFKIWHSYQDALHDAQVAFTRAQAELNILAGEELDQCAPAEDDDLGQASTEDLHVDNTQTGSADESASQGSACFDRHGKSEADGITEPRIQTSDEQQSVVVEGGNLGQSGAIRRQAWICGAKMGADRDEELAVARSRVAEARAELERATKAAKKHQSPRGGLEGVFLGILRRAMEFILPIDHKSEVRQGHVSYLDVVTALLHWNKRRNIVPGYLMEERREQDNEIILEVAFQFVQAVILGGVTRRRRRKAKALANTRLKRASQDARRMMRTLGSTRDMLNNKEADRIKALHDSHATPEAVQKYLKDPTSTPSRIMCAKIALYGIAVGHELAGLALEAGHAVEKYGIFGLSDEAIATTMLHPTMIAYSEHVKAIETTRSLLDNGQLPLLMLASQVHNIEWVENAEKMPKSDLLTLLNDLNVQTVISNIESNTGGNDAKRKRMLAAQAVPGGPGVHDAAMLLDDHILEELEDVRVKIKEKEAENETLNRTLEATQARMIELRTEHDALVEAASAQKTDKSTSRARRYDPAAAVTSSSGSQLQSQQHNQPDTEVRQPRPLEVASVVRAPLGEPANESHSGINNEHSSEQTTPQMAGVTAGKDVSHRGMIAAQAGHHAALPVADAQSGPIGNDPRKIEEQIANKKAEMERLQKMIEKARREAAGGEVIREEV